MAGPLTIQRVPRGLLHALGMKGTGDLPHNLAETLFSSFDATQLYLQDNARTAYGNTGNITAFQTFFTSTTANMTVPAGELWLMTNFSANVQGIIGAANVGWVPFIGYVRKAPYTANINFLAGSAYQPGFDANSKNAYLGWNGQVILRPGDQVGVVVGAMPTNALAANTTFDMWLDYYRLEF